MATKKAAKTTKKAPAKSAAKTTTRVRTVTADKAVVVEKSTVDKAAMNAGASTNRPVGRNYTSLAAASVGELIGTFILAAIVLSQAGQPIPVMFGITAAALGVGALSGSYLNPALTVGAWVTKRLDAARALFYIVAQVLGGMLALVIVDAFTKASAPALSAQAKAMGQAAPEVFRAAAVPAGKEWLVLFAEMLGMFIFALVVASAVSEKRKSLTTALSIATGLFAGLLVAGSATASLAAQGSGLSFLNPAVAIAAQALAPSIFSWWNVVIWLIAPLISGALAFGVYELLRPSRYERV